MSPGDARPGFSSATANASRSTSCRTSAPTRSRWRSSSGCRASGRPRRERLDRGENGLGRRTIRGRCGIRQHLLRRGRARAVLPAGHLAGLQVGVHAIGDHGDRAGHRHLGARVPLPGLAGASALPRQAPPHRARRDGRRGPAGAGGDARARAVRTAELRRGDGANPRACTSRGSARRRPRMNPFREILRRGVEMAARSDSPIHRARPDGGIAAFENHHDPGQRLSREEAIRVWTTGGAQLAHQEDKEEPGTRQARGPHGVRRGPVPRGRSRSARPVLSTSASDGTCSRREIGRAATDLLV